jgi:hypothetical protein
VLLDEHFPHALDCRSAAGAVMMVVEPLVCHEDTVRFGFHVPLGAFHRPSADATPCYHALFPNPDQVTGPLSPEDDRLRAGYASQQPMPYLAISEMPQT